eukprot:GCRY01002388.1.p1 GENE.GCRY01002388.1~~GCRY01002388.1.p1  ORF type:complete len:627 (+),score=218.72 GCRY01002388.1:222-2102(+)
MEVENILLLNIKQIGCDLPENISLKDFSAELTVKVTGFILNALEKAKVDEGEINAYNEKVHPSDLPEEMAGKFRVCSALAKVVKEFGYPNEIGYNNFLYPSVGELKSLFSFLIEKLPRSETEQSPQIQAEISLLDKISASLKAVVKDTHTASVTSFPPPYTWSSFQPQFVAWPTKRDAKKNTYVRSAQFPSFVAQTPAPCALSSALAYNTHMYVAENRWSSLYEAQAMQKGMAAAELEKQVNAKVYDAARAILSAAAEESVQPSGKGLDVILAKFLGGMGLEGTGTGAGSRFSKATVFSAETTEESLVKGKSKEEKEKELAASREEEIATLEAELEDGRAEIEQLRTDIANFQDSIKQLEADAIALKEEATALEDVYQIKKETLGLLPDADKNLADLRAITNKSQQKLERLATEWDKHRTPLEEELQQLKDNQRKMREIGQEKLETIKALRTDMKQIIADIKEREERIGAYQAEVERAKSENQRSYYTDRIFDIIKNLKKQAVDIEKILIDNKAMHKEINATSQTLGRSCALADEIIFKEAKKEKGSGPAAKNCYKLLARLNDLFNKLNTTVSETGGLAKQWRDLESKVEQLKVASANLNLDRIKTDLKLVKAENKALSKKIHATE